MFDQIFEGTSKVGNIAEAIAIAVFNAKENMQTDYVEWTLKDLNGKSGGFTQTNEITVSINAKGPGEKTKDV